MPTRDTRGIRTLEDFNIFWQEYLWRFFSRGICQCHSAAKVWKVPGLHSIYLELILHTDAALKSWLNKFLSFCMC